jgi:hypothetical protein
MLTPSEMPTCTMPEHDAIFALDDMNDEGESMEDEWDGLLELGEKVYPFSREFHVKLWQEIIHLWEIDSAVLFQPGSGQALLAFVLERKRAVGIVKNKAHKDFVYNNLVRHVKVLGLAPDKRPQKLTALSKWALAHAPPSSPSVPQVVPQKTPQKTKRKASSPPTAKSINTIVLDAGVEDTFGDELAAFGSQTL